MCVIIMFIVCLVRPRTKGYTLIEGQGRVVRLRLAALNNKL